MISLIAVALLQAAAGEPQEQAAAAENPPVVAADEQRPTNLQERQRRRCRVEVVTGSRLGERVCSSRAQEERWERDARDMIQRIGSDPKDYPQ